MGGIIPGLTSSANEERKGTLDVSAGDGSGLIDATLSAGREVYETVLNSNELPAPDYVPDGGGPLRDPSVMDR